MHIRILVWVCLKGNGLVTFKGGGDEKVVQKHLESNQRETLKFYG